MSHSIFFPHSAWLKFNDNSVSEATWEELQRESVGGHSNASAYSLVYLRSSKEEMLLAEGTGSVSGGGGGGQADIKAEEAEKHGTIDHIWERDRS